MGHKVRQKELCRTETPRQLSGMENKRSKQMNLLSNRVSTHLLKAGLQQINTLANQQFWLFQQLMALPS